MNPLLTLTPLTADVEHAIPQLANLEGRLGDAGSLRDVNSPSRHSVESERTLTRDRSTS